MPVCVESISSPLIYIIEKIILSYYFKAIYNMKSCRRTSGVQETQSLNKMEKKKTKSLKNVKDEKNEKVQDSVWLNLFMDDSYYCKNSTLAEAEFSILSE
jgi:hypothetical protein